MLSTGSSPAGVQDENRADSDSQKRDTHWRSPPSWLPLQGIPSSDLLTGRYQPVQPSSELAVVQGLHYSTVVGLWFPTPASTFTLSSWPLPSSRLELLEDLMVSRSLPSQLHFSLKGRSFPWTTRHQARESAPAALIESLLEVPLPSNA